jgi:hypothetical protein
MVQPKIDVSHHSQIAIGFCHSSFPFDHQPGWTADSWGYHGDDGMLFHHNRPQQAYGPTFKTGDVVGCCLDFANALAFYTLNGVDLGVAFRVPELGYESMFPCVGLHSVGERIRFNLGKEEFRFDIQEYVQRVVR